LAVMIGAPREGAICHDDLSPDNGVRARSGRLCAHRLGPGGIRTTGLGWRRGGVSVPLYDGAICERLGFPVGRHAERLRILSDAYACENAKPLASFASESACFTAHAWGEAGRPGWSDGA
jgi:hypothetical protein